MTFHSLKRAFTLVETIVVIALFVVISVVLGSFFISFNNFYQQQTAVRASVEPVNTALDELHTALLQADQVVASHTFGGVTYNSGSTALVLQLPSIDSSGFIVSGADDYEAFYLTNTTLYSAIDADASSARTSRTQALGDTVLSLTFAYDNTDVTKATMVTATVVATDTAEHETASTTGSVSVRLRNL